jgi:predicted dehydrogenase
MARTLADARRAIDAAKQAGVCLMVGHVLRFFPEYALAKRLLDEGAIGRPAVARTTRASAHPRTVGDWFADPEVSGACWWTWRSTTSTSCCGASARRSAFTARRSLIAGRR